MATLIIIVEDSPSQLFYLRKILEINEYEVISAENGIKALELLKNLEKLPELIISDINMPEMDGYDFFKNVSKNPILNRIPFIFISALDEPDDVRFGKMLGVDDYITKPFKSEDLLPVIAGKIARNKRTYEYNKKIDETLALELVKETFAPSNTEDNVILLVVFWDDAIGPMLTDTIPNNRDFQFSLNDIGNQLYQVAYSIYGDGYFEKAEGILINIKNINRNGFVFFDAYPDDTARGGERDYMLAIIAPKINYFESLRLKKILTDLSYKIKNKNSWKLTIYWKKILEILVGDI
ncbi:MAG: PleD family two-component system response regulator [Candidatus Hermodarchaeota archaeon]